MSTENGTPNGVGTVVAADVESGLARIAGIRAARVMLEPDGRVSEIHVLAEPGRSPKQLVRDVQSAVLTSFGLTVDYRVISVVLLDREPPATNGNAPPVHRPVLRRLAAETASFSTEVRVGVALDGEEIDRTMRGPATAGLRLVAQATIDAVQASLSAESVEVETAEVFAAGPRQVGVVVLRVLTGRGDHVVSGSAIVRRDPADAIARASLSAVNRFLG